MTLNLAPTSLDKMDDKTIDTKMSTMLGSILGTISADRFDLTQENNEENNDHEQSENENEAKQELDTDFKPKLTTEIEKILNESTDTTTTANTSTLLNSETPTLSTINDSTFSPIKQREAKEKEKTKSHTNKTNSSSDEEEVKKTEKTRPKQTNSKAKEIEESEYDYYYSDSEKEEKPLVSSKKQSKPMQENLQISSLLKKETNQVIDKVENKEIEKEQNEEQRSDNNTTLVHDILATGDLEISAIIPEKTEPLIHKIENVEKDKEGDSQPTEKEAPEVTKEKEEENNTTKNNDMSISSMISKNTEQLIDKVENDDNKKNSPESKSLDNQQEIKSIPVKEGYEYYSSTSQEDQDKSGQSKRRRKKKAAKERNNESNNNTTLSLKNTVIDTLSAVRVTDESDPTMDATEDNTENDQKREIEKETDETKENQDLTRTEVVPDTVGTSSSSPRIPESCYLNLDNVKSLEPQDDKGPTYTYTMPGNLHKVVYHSPDSLVCKALAMCPLPPLTKDEKDSLISDLLKYTSICSEKGMIYEAAYVSNIKDTIRNTPDFVTVKYDLKRCQESLNYAEDEINAQKKFWENQRMMIQTEYETGMKELEMRHHQQQDMLDQEWQSTRKMQQYSKPSPQLLDLRYKTSRLISTKQFERAKQNGQKLAEMEAIECEENTRRMNEAYRLADANLERKYQHDCEVLKVIRDKKMDAATHSEERAFKPVNRRYEKLSAEKARLQATADRGLPIPGKQIPQFSQQSNLPFIDLNSTPKLNLKKVTLINRNRGDKTKQTTQRNSRPQSAMSVSTPKPLVYRGERNNRSPSRLGKRND